jgi:NTE family protein
LDYFPHLMIMKKFITGIFVVLLINLQIPVFAQTAQTAPPAPKRLKVGLVLSGGGARGFAHIGVLKVLEANHIPVDYIGGASIGALVGAMYAMGKTPAEMEQLAATLEWNKLLLPTSSFKNLSFRRKEDRRNIPSPIILKGGPKDLKLPNALNSGHEIGLLFDRLTLPYATVPDFDALPIPFRAVGTNMVNGDSIALKSGSLSRALRATMSIPGVFSPVEIDGKILADGGLVNNIPTDVVKAMGADILIVVNIETPLGGRDSLDSFPSIFSQTLNIATLDNSRRSLRQADFIIAPDLETFSLADFSESAKIVELGVKGAEQKIALLKSLSLDDAAWAEHLANRRRREVSDTTPVPTLLAVAGNDEYASRTIKEKLGDKYTGQPLDAAKQDELARDLTDLTGTGRFDSLDYGLVKKDGATELIIRTNNLEEKPSVPTRLELGFDVNSVESDNVNFNFMARLTFFDFGRVGAEWRNDLRIGSNTFIGSEYYRPLGKTKFFVAPRLSYERRRINIFDTGTRLAEDVGEQVQVGADLGYAIDSRSEFRAGYTFGYQSASRRIGDPLLPNVKGRFSVAGLRWNYDGLDKAQVPTHGILTRNTVNYYFDSPGATKSFTQADTQFNAFHALDKSNILFGFGGGGTTFGDTAPIIQQFTLGGPFRLGGYGFEELRASNYIQAGGGILHNPKVIPSFLGGKVYLGAWYEAGSSFERFSTANFRQSVSGGTIIETPLGPVFIGGSFNENGRGRFYFSFGRFFR